MQLDRPVNYTICTRPTLHTYLKNNNKIQCSPYRDMLGKVHNTLEAEVPPLHGFLENFLYLQEAQEVRPIFPCSTPSTFISYGPGSKLMNVSLTG